MELSDVLQVKNENNLKLTLRQFARTYGTAIWRVASHFSIVGDLAKKLGGIDPSIDDNELIWLSNFQMDNNDCPQKIRDILMEHYNLMFKKK